DQITSDLQAAILRNDGNVWMAATMQTTNPGNWTAGGDNTYDFGSATPPKLEDYRFGPYGVWFRFFTTVPGTNTANDLTTLSAPRAVAYQIARLPVVAGSTEIRYQMFRSEVLPNLTFTTGYNLLDAAYSSASLAPNNGQGSIRHPELGNVIANNVVDFGVRIYTSAGLRFPQSASDTFLATSDATKGPNYGIPESVEVFVRILSVEGSQQLALYQAGTITGNWWDIVQANSRVYTRRVDLKAKGL
ncbi:MAG: hypothetical protein K0R17_2735, partial [Rariglobus sp.]|nr:hypothetical protein [Rariglobus sp.]